MSLIKCFWAIVLVVPTMSCRTAGSSAEVKSEMRVGDQTPYHCQEVSSKDEVRYVDFVLGMHNNYPDTLSVLSMNGGTYKKRSRTNGAIINAISATFPSRYGMDDLPSARQEGAVHYRFERSELVFGDLRRLDLFFKEADLETMMSKGIGEFDVLVRYDQGRGDAQIVEMPCKR
jgi:hypothetical protein